MDRIGKLTGRRRIVVAAAVCGLVLAAGAVLGYAQSPEPPGRIGAARALLNSGRQLHPFGRLTAVGNFPAGAALTPDGRFYWTVSAGRGIDDIRIVSVRDGAVTQTLRLPGASGGIAMDPAHRLAYVAGVADSPYRDQKSPPNTPGAGGDVIHVFRYDAAGHATFDRVIAVPPPPSAPAAQSFPPGTAKLSWPDHLAVSPDGRRLLVALNLADAAAVVDTSSNSVAYVPTGNYPFGAAISRDGKLGFVSNETPGTVSVIDMATATKLSDVQVGAHLSHPEAIAADPVADRVYVAVTNSDEVAVIDTNSRQLIRTLAVGRPEGLGTAPDALTVTPDGRRLVVAEGGANELSVFALPGALRSTAVDYGLIGRIPTAQLPTDVRVTAAGQNPCQTAAAASPPAARAGKHKRRHHRTRPRRRRHRARSAAAHKHGARHRRHARRRRAGRAPAVAPAPVCSQLVYTAAKGLGTNPNPGGPQPDRPTDTDDRINETSYLPFLNIGSAGVGDLPPDPAIATQTAVADAQVRPSNPQSAPADTPLRAGGPIKHVFYIVRENRTYDQILGDDARGDGDPKLATFAGKTTPDAHALVKRFPLLDHFYSNSEISIDGHFWTAAAQTSDYVHRNWFANYASRGRPYDFGVYAVTWPGNGFLFDQADRQGISYFNYGEAVAGVVPVTDRDRTSDENARVQQKFAKSDLGLGATQAGVGNCYANDASVGQDVITKQTVFDSTPPLGAPPQSESRFNCFSNRFATQVAQGTVPTFNMMMLSNDHTRVLDPGFYTPAAMIADNDYGLGQIVDLISHSSIWDSSAIFVTEDDSQDGADHVDAHRTVGLVISPYAKQGAVVHTRYDMLSMIRSIELIMGMRSLYLDDALATPMYDAFTSTPSNAAPFTAVAPQIDLLATNPAATSRADAAARRFRGLDQMSQAQTDRVLWRSVHGPSSPPPPPGPNARDHSLR